MEKIPVRPDGLQLEEDRSFQERYWTAERVAWLAFTLILVGALAGISGSGGPVSTQTVGSPGGEIISPRIARWDADERLVLAMPPGEQRTRTVFLDRGFLDDFQIEAVTPEPTRSHAGLEGIRLEFETDDGSALVTLHIRPERSGRSVYRIGLDDTEEVEMATWVLP